MKNLKAERIYYIDNSPKSTLWEQYRQNPDAEIRNRLVLEYMNLVEMITHKMKGMYRKYGDMDDVVNEGVIALMDAVEKYDPDKNVKFETFASIKIRGAIIDFVRKQDWTPRSVKKAVKTIDEAKTQLYSQLGHVPDDRDVCEYLDISPGELAKVQADSCAANLFSFEQLIYEKVSEETNFEEREQYIGSDPQSIFQKKELVEQLTVALSQLNEREQLVISLYYNEGLKFKEIAEVLEISASRLSQIYSRIINKLKSSLENYVVD